MSIVLVFCCFIRVCAVAYCYLLTLLFLLSIVYIQHIAGSRDTIGADLLVPLFTMVLINAQLPNVHMILQVYALFYVVCSISVILKTLDLAVLFHHTFALTSHNFFVTIMT